MKKLPIFLLFSLFAYQQSFTMDNRFINNEEGEVRSPIPQTVDNLMGGDLGSQQEIYMQIEQQRQQKLGMLTLILSTTTNITLNRLKSMGYSLADIKEACTKVNQVPEHLQMEIIIEESKKQEISRRKPKQDPKHNRNNNIDELANKILNNPTISLQELKNMGFSIETVKLVCQNLGFTPEQLEMDIVLEESQNQRPQTTQNNTIDKKKVETIKDYIMALRDEYSQATMLTELRENGFNDLEIQQAFLEMYNRQEPAQDNNLVVTNLDDASDSEEEEILEDEEMEIPEKKQAYTLDDDITSEEEEEE